VSFPQASDGGVTGHLSNTITAMRDESYLRSHPLSGESGFTTGMSPTDDNYIKRIMSHVKQPYLPMQKLEKMPPRTSSTPIRPIS
jgi:hypothetical protein